VGAGCTCPESGPAFWPTQGVVGMARYDFEYAADCGRVIEAKPLAVLAIQGTGFGFIGIVGSPVS